MNQRATAEGVSLRRRLAEGNKGNALVSCSVASHPAPRRTRDDGAPKSKRNGRKWTINFIRTSFGAARRSCKTVIYLQCELIDLQSQPSCRQRPARVSQPPKAAVCRPTPRAERSAAPLSLYRSVYYAHAHACACASALFPAFFLLFPGHSVIITAAAQRSTAQRRARYQHI